MTILGSDGQPIRADIDVVQPVAVETVGERIKPRETGTGFTRGEQTIAGLLNMVDSVNVRRMTINSPESIIKISQPGIDVTQATDEQLIFNSNQNIVKVIKADTVQLGRVPAASGASEGAMIKIVDTGVKATKVPAVIAFVEGDTGYSQLPNFGYYYDAFSHPEAGARISQHTYCEVYVDQGIAKLVFASYNFINSPVVPRKARYFLLQESIT